MPDYNFLMQLLPELKAFETERGRQPADMQEFTQWLAQRHITGPSTLPDLEAKLEWNGKGHGGQPHYTASNLLTALARYKMNYVKMALEGTPFETYDEFIMALTAARSQLLALRARARRGARRRPCLVYGYVRRRLARRPAGDLRPWRSRGAGGRAGGLAPRTDRRSRRARRSRRVAVDADPRRRPPGRRLDGGATRAAAARRYRPRLGTLVVIDFEDKSCTGALPKQPTDTRRGH